MILQDTNNDGEVDKILKDKNHDGIIDERREDRDFDGKFETVLKDTNFDGKSRRAAAGRAQLRALTFLEARYGAFSAKMQTAGTLRVPSRYPPGRVPCTFRRGLIWKIRQKSGKNPAKFGQNLAKFVKISEIWRKN